MQVKNNEGPYAFGTGGTGKATIMAEIADKALRDHEDRPAFPHAEEAAGEKGFADEVLMDRGESLRELGTEALVANIIDAMKAKARLDGQCTYYTGTFAVARETLATAGLTCEIDPDWRMRARAKQPGVEPPVRWIAFFGDEWEYLKESGAIKLLLAERS